MNDTGENTDFTTDENVSNATRPLPEFPPFAGPPPMPITTLMVGLITGVTGTCANAVVLVVLLYGRRTRVWASTSGGEAWKLKTVSRGFMTALTIRKFPAFSCVVASALFVLLPVLLFRLLLLGLLLRLSTTTATTATATSTGMRKPNRFLLWSYCTDVGISTIR